MEPKDTALITNEEYVNRLLALQPAYDLYSPMRLATLALGLCGESGEATELIKKHLRDETPLDIPLFIKELGDVIAYVTLLADTMGYSLDEVQAVNIHKLESRLARGKSKGAGNER